MNETRIAIQETLNEARAAWWTFRRIENEHLNAIHDIHIKSKLLDEKIQALERTLHEMRHTDQPNSYFVRNPGR